MLNTGRVHYVWFYRFNSVDHRCRLVYVYCDRIEEADHSKENIACVFSGLLGSTSCVHSVFWTEEILRF